jgi:hypothetical protein
MLPEGKLPLDAANDQSVDPAAGTQLADIGGKFALASGEALPENLFVNLQPVQKEDPGVGNEQVNKDGTFTIHNVPPGTYRINFFGAGRQFHVARVVANGAKVDHRQITVASSPVSLAGLLNPDLGLSVSGFVKRDGKPVPGDMVVLVPDDPVNDRDDFRRDQSNSDGSFDLMDVQPGKYTIVAIQDGWTLDWATPGVIRRYLPDGQPINITEHSPQNIKLPQPVDAQTK